MLPDHCYLAGLPSKVPKLKSAAELGWFRPAARSMRAALIEAAGRLCEQLV